MKFLQWITVHGPGALEAIGIIASLLFTAVSLRRDASSRRTENLITLTAQHRDIWKQFYENPKLARIRDSKADTENQPPSVDEMLFVNLLILHLNCWFQAIQRREVTPPEGLGMDVGAFYSLPVPNTVWNLRKHLHDGRFVKFVEAAIRVHSSKIS